MKEKLRPFLKGITISVVLAVASLPFVLLFFTNVFKTGEVWEENFRKYGPKYGNVKIFIKGGIPYSAQKYFPNGKLKCETTFEGYECIFHSKDLSDEDCVKEMSFMREDWDDGDWDSKVDIRLWIFKFKQPGY